MSGLIVVGVILTTSRNDSDPLESEGAKNGETFLATSLCLVVVGLGPDRVLDGEPSPFNEGLMKEVRWVKSAMCPTLLSTAFDHWSYANVSLCL